MNIVKAVKDRITNAMIDTKKPCKMYTTEAMAEKKTIEIAEMVGEHHHTRPANYIVIYHEGLERWVGAIDLNEVIRRPDAVGGYVGLAASKGFYTF